MSFLFGSPQKAATPTTPAVAPVQRMPVPNSVLSRQAAQRERSRITNRSGRSSTILTRRGEPGTNAYSNSLLGQAG